MFTFMSLKLSMARRNLTIGMSDTGMSLSFAADVNGLRFARRVRSLSSRGDVRRGLPELGRSFTVSV
jgi:hypothetical protein